MASSTQRRRFPLNARLTRLLLGVYPPYVGAGISVDRISRDFREIEVTMKLRWYNQNLFGTQFGGSLFSMLDPFYASMVLRNLGDDYVVWDKDGRIDFVAPARSHVHASFRLEQTKVDQILEETKDGGKSLPSFKIPIVDVHGVCVAIGRRTLYVRRKRT